MVVKFAPLSIWLRRFLIHLPASLVVTDLQDHPPFTVGAARRGSWSSWSTSRCASLQTFKKASPQGGDVMPHTGTTNGMEIPPFATSLAVLWDRVRHSRYPEILPSSSAMSATKLYIFRMSDHLLLLYKQNSMHPQATRSVRSALSSERNISKNSTSWTVRTLACTFSFRIESCFSMSRFTFAETMSVCSPQTSIPTTYLQKLSPSTKPLMLEAGLFSDTKLCTNSSTISVDRGNGHMPKYLPLYHLTNWSMLVPLRRTVPWLLFPKRTCMSARRCSLIAALRSNPRGQASRPLEKIMYHFSRALVIAASSTSCSVRVESKLMTSLYTPRIVLPKWWGTTDEDWLLNSENSMGVITGTGMSLAGSLLKILESPFRSHGIWNLKVGLTDKHALSIMDFKFLLSVSFKNEEGSSGPARSSGVGTEYSSHWAGLSRPNKSQASGLASLSASKFSGRGNWTVLDVMDSRSESSTESGGRLTPLLIRPSRWAPASSGQKEKSRKGAC